MTDSLSSISLSRLEADLESTCGDLSLIRSTFKKHVASNFLSDFIRDELNGLVQDPDRPIRRVAGQVCFVLINTPLFEYSVRLSPPFQGRPHALKWLGEKQMIVVKGGSAIYRLLKVSADINQFESGRRIPNAELDTLYPDVLLESSSSNHILDIYEVKEPVVLEVLRIHDRAVELHWTFDEQLVATFAESAQMSCSRLQNTLELALRMNIVVPSSVYEVIFRNGNGQEKLLGIQSLLATGAAAGFRELQLAVESSDAVLSTGAKTLLETLLR